MHETPQVTLSFSELKYLFECSYQFKLRFLYGFNAPIHEALGYGKGLHDALSEIHKRALEGDIVTKASAAALIDRHLNAPFAYPALREQLRNAGIKAIERYFDTHGKEIANTEFSEKQIQVHVAPGITVDGRIDLIRRLDTGEVAIVDFKSTDRAQAEDVTRDQLHVYAVGYQELTGKSADLIEVLNLDEKGKTTREPVDDPLLTAVRRQDPGRRRGAAHEQASASSDVGRARVRIVRPRRAVPGAAKALTGGQYRQLSPTPHYPQLIAVVGAPHRRRRTGRARA